MPPVIEYVPNANRAALRVASDDWSLLLESPNDPVEIFVLKRSEVGDAIGERNLSDHSKVIDYVGRCLVSIGYSIEPEAPPFAGAFIAAWALAPAAK